MAKKPDIEIPDKFVELGIRRTREIVRIAVYHPNAGSLTQAFAVAYLKGVEDGWTARENQEPKPDK